MTNAISNLRGLFWSLPTLGSLVVWGCSQSSYDTHVGGALPNDGSGPAQQALNLSVTCKHNGDCEMGDVCEQNVCQVQACSDSNQYHSVAPLGSRKALAKYQELVVLPTNVPTSPPHVYERRGTQLQPHAMTVPWSVHSAHGDNVVALVGGDFVGQSPEQMAVAYQGEFAVYVQAGAEALAITMGFSPVALAAGNVDGGGLDNLVALGAHGEVAICSVPMRHCQSSNVEGVHGKDVAVADVDGDGLEEIVFLVDVGGKQQLRVWKADQEHLNSGDLQQSLQSLIGSEGNPWHDLGTFLSVNFENASLHLNSIAAGDFNGSGKAKIVGLESGSSNVYFDPLHAVLHTFEVTTDNRAVETGKGTKADMHASRLVIGNTKGDGRDELLVLSDTGAVQGFEADAQSGEFKSLISSSLGGEGHGSVVAAMVDMTGGNIIGKLVDGPHLTSDKVLPVELLIFPPYNAQFSAGTSSVATGDTQGETMAEGSSVSVYYQGGFTLTGLPTLPLQSLALNLPMRITVSPWGMTLVMKHLRANSHVVGQYYSAAANPAIYGPSYATVVLSRGCYHRYSYQLVDPQGKTGGDAQKVMIHTYVPVDGQMAFLPTTRYNALAKELKGLPQINVPVTLGEPASYPKEPSTLAGRPLPQVSLIYQDKPIDVSPLASTKWLFSLGQAMTDTNDQGHRTIINATPNLSLPGLGGVGPGFFTEDIAYRWQLTAIEVSQNTLFSGTVPPIAENTRAPEDRWAYHNYAFTPYLYQEHYQDSLGKDAAFYVLAYTVNQQQQLWPNTCLP